MATPAAAMTRALLTTVRQVSGCERAASMAAASVRAGIRRPAPGRPPEAFLRCSAAAPGSGLTGFDPPGGNVPSQFEPWLVHGNPISDRLGRSIVLEREDLARHRSAPISMEDHDGQP